MTNALLGLALSLEHQHLPTIEEATKTWIIPFVWTHGIHYTFYFMFVANDRVQICIKILDFDT